MNKWYSYEDENYEVFVERSVYIKEKATDDVYKISIKTLTPNLRDKLTVYKPKISRKMSFLWCLMLGCNIGLNLLFLFLYLKADTSFPYQWNTLLGAFGFLIFFVVSHELSHMKALSYFGKKYSKIGCKLNYYIFPAIYVEMNEVSLIAEREKLIVHSAGLMTNYLTLNTLYLMTFLLPNIFLLSLFKFFSYMTLLNLIPFLNSDGYKMLMVALHIDELKDYKKNNVIISGIQAIGVIIAIYSGVQLVSDIYHFIIPV